MTCPICQRAALDSESAIAIQACDSCAREHGIIPMPLVTRIPIHPHLMTELVDYDAGLYR